MDNKMIAQSDALKKELVSFLEYHNPHQIKNNLNKLIISYMICHKDDLPDYFHELLISLEGLFDFLEVAGKEGKSIILSQ